QVAVWRLGPSALRATADKGSLRLALCRLRSEGPCRFDYSRLQCEPQVFGRCRDPGSRFVCCAGETFAIPVGCTGDAPPQAAPTLVKELARYVEQRGLLIGQMGPGPEPGPFLHDCHNFLARGRQARNDHQIPVGSSRPKAM